MQALKALKTRTALLVTVSTGTVAFDPSKGWSDRTKKAGIVPVRWS